LAARRAAVSRSCTDLLERAVRHLATGAAGSNAFFAPVLPEADALESTSDITVVVGAAEAIVAAHGFDPANARFAHRRL
jgi:hypothetical protein